MDWARELAKPEWYREQLERLVRKQRANHTLYDLQLQGVSLVTLHRQRRAFARRLAAVVTRGEYRFSPARIRLAQLDRPRRIFSYEISDLLVNGVVATLLRRAWRPSPGLYSYISGRSNIGALRDFTAFLRRHRRHRPDPRHRGLFVLRCDVRSYGESLPIDDSSALWRQLDALLRQEGGGAAPDHVQELVRCCVRPPEVLDEMGAPLERDRGIPDGAPIGPALANLYLDPLDRLLCDLTGGFYARYGDDILFAHPEAEVAAYALEQIEHLLRKLRLSLNSDKLSALYFNGAGRAPAAGRGGTTAPAFSPAAALEFLGARVSFAGTVGLKQRRVRELFFQLERRVVQSCRLLAHLPAEELGPALCAVINRALDPRDPLALPQAAWLRSVCNDRQQLHQLDYRLARLAARAVTGQAGPRCFRRAPWRRLRREWGLDSLVHARNADHRRCARR